MKLYSIIYQSLITITFFLLLSSCSNDDVINTSEFIVAGNHTIELVAAEPNVILPVAMVEDKRNRLWLVEMPGYMRDIDGSDEYIPDGRIVILSDSDQDGKIDNRKIFLDSLENPRAICLINDGVLYSDGTQLKWTETKDDTPNNTIIVDSFYVIGGNIEHQPNGLLYNLDNWIYSAKSNVRYRFKNGKWKKEATTFRGQWGISMDRLGRLVYNHNSAPLISDHSMPNQNLANPYLKLKHSTGNYLTDDMRIYPIQATAVNRGYLPEVLDSTGKVINYTSACAPHIFYGSELEQQYQSSAFVCAPEGNLISNYSYEEKTQDANRSLGQNEFLISKDESFRPVNLMTGFDGCLYIVDIRKGIIQHSAYMSSYLRDKIISKGLDKVNGKGRIYRVKKANESNHASSTNNLSSDDLLKLLSSDNLQLRIFAQKELIFKNDKNDITSLNKIALNSDDPNAQIHALWTLEGLDALRGEQLIKIGKVSSDPDVLTQLMILSKSISIESKLLDKVFLESLLFNSKQLDFILASVVGGPNQFEKIWLLLAKKYSNDPLICESLVSSIYGRESYFLSKINVQENEILSSIINEVIANKKANEIQSPILIEKPFDDDRTNGLKKFKSYCVSCHGYDGNGLKNLAPSLKESKIIDGKESEIASIILNGYSSDNSVYKVAMPAYKEDKNLTDQDIVDIISYLKSTFTSDWSSLKVEDVNMLRD